MRARSGYEHFQGRGSSYGGLGAFLASTRTRVALAATAAFSALYYWWCLEEVPYTRRRHSIMLVSEANEKLMGKAVFEEQRALARAQHQLLPDSHPAVQRVKRLGMAIAAVAADGAGGGRVSHMKDLAWEFAVIQNPVPNAFVVPGGKVVVFTGLLDLLGPDDDQLAAVMAHEVAHVLARHQAERLSTLNVWALLNMVVRLTLGFGLPNLAMYMGIFLPYSRLAETEADQVGLRLMARACFVPTAAPLMLAKLNAKEKDLEQKRLVPQIPLFLRTHPLTEDRVVAVQRDMPEAVRLYEHAGCPEKRAALRRSFLH